MGDYFDGYGVNLDEVDTYNLDWKKLLSFDKSAEDEYLKYLKEEEKEYGVYSFIDWADDYGFQGYCGLPALIQSIINISEGIELECSDTNNTVYFPKKYSWNYSEKEKELTEDKLNEIFKKYIVLLSGEQIKVTHLTMWDD